MTPLPESPLVDRLRAETERRGFTLFGVAPATDADGFGRFEKWLDDGYAGEMSYLHKHREHRRNPRGVLGRVRSVVMLGMEYLGENLPPPRPPPSWEEGGEFGQPPTPPPSSQEGGGRGVGSGRIARYAQGPDYHRVVWDKLNELSAWLMAEVPGSVAHGTCDSAPLLERDFARRAGLGWFGKNTMLINTRRGSFFFLAGLLTSVELPASEPHTGSHCGTCTACLDACPTQAFPEPGVLDATKCISYLTIELRGAIPLELREPVGNWLFGCDVCQDVCPWNREPSATSRDREGAGDAAPAPSRSRLVGGDGVFPSNPALAALDPIELLSLTPAEFAARFAGTSLLRTRRTGLLRNAAIVLGNTGDERAMPALERAMTDADEVIADAAAWAVKRIGQRTSSE